ncbi:MAG: 16S rRNA (guanine(966)-N(2))-methyltransferase RsmD [Acidobacteriota bacterium]|nr:16S rRNA (guanine(966)-N(2))-methyltransferase RsmD [Acidobacteriota bacterium]
MRIVGGELRGRKLVGVPRHGVRPTSDPVREALFNLLGEQVRERPFVDLFAGTGAVACEAFSRGARPIELVESDPRVIVTIERNLGRLGIEIAPHAAVVHCAEVGAWLRERAAGSKPFGAPAVIFLDPPYTDRRLARWLTELERSALWVPDALVVVEHAARVSGPLEPLKRVELVWSRRYGDSALTAGRVLGPES